MAVLAHPDRRAEELVASLTLEACPYGLGYSLLRHDITNVELRNDDFSAVQT